MGEGGSSKFSNDKHLKQNIKVVENSLIKERRDRWEREKRRLYDSRIRTLKKGKEL